MHIIIKASTNHDLQYPIYCILLVHVPPVTQSELSAVCLPPPPPQPIFFIMEGFFYFMTSLKFFIKLTGRRPSPCIQNMKEHLLMHCANGYNLQNCTILQYGNTILITVYQGGSFSGIPVFHNQAIVKWVPKNIFWPTESCVFTCGSIK